MRGKSTSLPCSARISSSTTRPAPRHHGGHARKASPKLRRRDGPGTDPRRDGQRCHGLAGRSNRAEEDPLLRPRQGQALNTEKSAAERGVTEISSIRSTRARPTICAVTGIISPLLVESVTLHSHAAGPAAARLGAGGGGFPGLKRQMFMPAPNGPRNPTALEEAKKSPSASATSSSPTLLFIEEHITAILLELQAAAIIATRRSSCISAKEVVHLTRMVELDM